MITLAEHLYKGSYLIGDMHIRGVNIDLDYIDELEVELNTLIDTKRKACEELYEGNPGSPFEVLEAYEHFGYVIDNTKEETLSAIDIPYTECLLEWRKAQKLYSVYVKGLQKWLDPYGYIHAQFNPASTRTGRLSSDNPNLQNIPRGSNIRRLFIPSEGYRFIDADYSQLEFRVAAGLSQDPKIIEYINAGRDVHKEVASKAFRIPVEEVTKPIRTKAKEIVFGGLFLMQIPTLAHKLNISNQEAKSIFDTAYGDFHVLRKWIEAAWREDVEKQFTQTRLGRIRHYPLVTPTNERQIRRYAVNTRIQGQASDICWNAAYESTYDVPTDELRPVLLVHDAIIYEERLDCDHLDYVQHVMTNCTLAKDIGVKLDVDAKRCNRWGG